MRQKPLTSVELFSGAGGLALGVARAGFEHRLLLEYNRDACKTLRLNHDAFGGAACQLHEGDVRAFDFRPYAGTDLLAAGAPCQPFSIGGRHRAHSDERNLFPQVFRAAREILPKAILVENVRGLLRPALAEFVEYIQLQLAYPFVIPTASPEAVDWRDQLAILRGASQGPDKLKLRLYHVQAVLMNAADFGVAQRRERVFFVALRSDLGVDWAPPPPTHDAAALRLAQQFTGAYWKAHDITRRVRKSALLEGRLRREAGKLLPWQTVRDALHGLPEPAPGKESAGWRNHVGQAGARSYPGHTGSPLDAPAKTLKAGVHGVPGGENMLRRPNGTVRYFTVREAARLQSFPDSYEFAGAWGEAMRQIGNAVPVRLAEVVAGTIRRALEGSSGQRRRSAGSTRAYEQAELHEMLSRSA